MTSAALIVEIKGFHLFIVVDQLEMWAREGVEGVSACSSGSLVPGCWGYGRIRELLHAGSQFVQLL